MAFGGAALEQAFTFPVVKEPSRLHEFFELQVVRRGRATAIEAGGQSLSYQELDALANRIAHWLRDQGVRPGSLVGLYLTKSVELFAGMLGILKAGAGYVPVDPKFPAERVQDIFADADVRAIITNEKLAANLSSELPARILAVDRDASVIAGRPWGPLPPQHGEARPDGVCYVIYTSGSTGRPKGVMIAHRNAIAFVRTLATVYKVTPQDRIYQGFSVAFDASVEEIWAAFSIGGTLVVAPEEVARSPLDVAEFLTANRISYFSTVPTFLAMIGADLPTVELLVLGGEACMPELVTRWARPGRRLLNTYGPTEATVVATWAECVPGEPVTIGKALPGYETFVLDDNLKPVAPGEVGELFIGGAGVALGYLNRPELTAERFVANPFVDALAAPEQLYRTHDLVRLMPDRQLQFLGRIDGQIKIRGFRVELSEIEAVLMEYPGIRAAAVRVVQNAGMQELAAYIVADAAALLVDRAGIAELLRSRLPEYMVPKYLDTLADLPTLTSGKVDRKQLPDPQTLLKGQEREAVPPADEMETAVAAAWETCLRVSPISVEDDFFLDLGGHSLLAAQLVTELRSKLATTRISVRDLYKNRTVRALAAHLRSLGICPTLVGEAACSGEPTASERAFAQVSRFERSVCVGLQGLAVVAFFAFVSAPAVYVVLMLTAIADGRIAPMTALGISTALGFAVWPCMLAFSVVLKWLVIGRYRAGRYPVWSFYYLRWWLVNRFQYFSWSEMFVGTPLMNLYFRAMGAKVGKGATICTPYCSAFDVVSIGEGASIGVDTQLLGYRVEDGMLIIGEIEIGRNCFVGMHACLGLGVRMGDGARLDDMSLLVDGSSIGPGEGRRGSPAIAADVKVPGQPGTGGNRRPVLYGFLHLVLIYVMGYFIIGSLMPGIALVVYALMTWGSWAGLAAAFVAVPLGVFWYCLLLVAVKWLFIGRMKAGVYRLDSVHYLRHWFLDYLLSNSRSILLPVYATLYLPTLLRLLGARIGRGTEVSTVMHVSPDLLEIGSGSFMADACLVGGHRIHNGVMEARGNRIGDKTFIGNSALLPGGIDVGNDALIGVLSAPPTDIGRVPDGTRWLGSPGFALPNARQELNFDAAATYKPTRGAYLARGLVDATRVFLPGMITTATLALLVTYLVIGFRSWPLWVVLAGTPFISIALAYLATMMVAAVKEVLIGAFEPTVKPLWCRYVWFNEVVNGVFESVAALAMAPMMGTPFIAPGLRLMGCKIGRWVYMETTFFSEFDLVEIGDHSALNLGATIQTHLFEDRVMKSDYLRLAEGCSVGNMAVVLYSTQMQRGASLGSLSVLMKGETLPPGSRWCGIPSEPMESVPACAQPTPRLGVVRRLRRGMGYGCDRLAQRVRGNMVHMTLPGQKIAGGIVWSCQFAASRLGA